MSITELEKEIVSRLRPINPDRIILFGSYGYGNPDKDSDLDLCIITDYPGSKSEKKRRIRFLLKGLTIAKDILTPSSEEYDFYKKEIGSVYMEIDKNGRILWQSS
jgi:predicted nucleotidyltransferase